MFNIIYRKHGNKCVRKQTVIKKAYEQLTVIWLHKTIYLLRTEHRGSLFGINGGRICTETGFRLVFWPSLVQQHLMTAQCSFFCHLELVK